MTLMGIINSWCHQVWYYWCDLSFLYIGSSSSLVFIHLIKDGTWTHLQSQSQKFPIVVFTIWFLCLLTLFLVVMQSVYKVCFCSCQSCATGTLIHNNDWYNSLMFSSHFLKTGMTCIRRRDCFKLTKRNCGTVDWLIVTRELDWLDLITILLTVSMLV